MAADVLTYNALQEINQELKAESVGLTSAIAEAAPPPTPPAPPAPTSEGAVAYVEVMKGAGSPNLGLSCMIPRYPDGGSSSSWTSGFQVCDTSQYHRCGCCCQWTVPGGVTCARFQIWGAGGGSGTGCCCGGSPNGGSGAYASVIMPVTSGQQYTLCAGCAYCCYAERSQMTADGYPSYVQGPGLTNFCAEGGESNIFCEAKTRCTRGPGIQGVCKFMGSCICNNGTDYCSHDNETPGVGYPDNRREAAYQSTANCKTHFGTVSAGSTIYGLPGQYSYFAYDFGSNELCLRHPGMYGFVNCSCCSACMSNENGGCCWQACYCQAMCCIPGAGAWGYSTCGGDNHGCSDIGRTGMVCVSYC